MKRHFIEATNGFNWGKFMVIQFDGEDYAVESSVAPGHSLLRSIGFGSHLIWVLDLQTKEGAAFVPGGLPSADLNKHKVWVCPMFEPFLEWLYKQDVSDITKLPATVTFTQEETAEHSAMYGHRRKGPTPPAA